MKKKQLIQGYFGSIKYLNIIYSTIISQVFGLDQWIKQTGFGGSTICMLTNRWLNRKTALGVYCKVVEYQIVNNLGGKAYGIWRDMIRYICLESSNKKNNGEGELE